MNVILLDHDFLSFRVLITMYALRLMNRSLPWLACVRADLYVDSKRMQSNTKETTMPSNINLKKDHPAFLSERWSLYQ